MPRKLTPAEKQRFQACFPNLDVNLTVVTGAMSTVYNCISWTIGFTDRWLWPGNSLVDFDAFYKGFGFVRSVDGTIAAWGLSPTSMTHGSVSGPGHGPRWESKCGSDLRIQHGLGELAGSSYGHVVAFYRRPGAVGPYGTALEGVMKENTARSYLSAVQRRVLKEQRARIPEAIHRTFEQRFAAWNKTWFSGGMAINSDPRARRVGREYDALIAMGPVILPLLIEQLADPENFMALQLYDAIQSNEKLLVQYGPEDERIREGEQGRARRTVQAWFTNQ